MNISTGVIAKAQKVVLYGTEGIGKSTFASQFPNPLFIDTEGSTGNMDVARMDKPTSYTMLQQQIQFVKMNRPCQTLVIDTIDWAERLMTEHVCGAANKKSITEFGYGEGFIQLEEEVGRFLNSLTDLIDVGINVVLTAHAKITKFEQPDEMGAYDRYELKLGNKTTAKTASLVKEWGDMVLFANYKTFSVATNDKGTKHKGQGGARVIYTTHHPAWDAKNRHRLPDEIPMDYGQIAHIFATQPVQVAQATPQAPVNQPVPPQTPSQVPEQPVPAPMVPAQEQPQAPVQPVSNTGEVQQTGQEFSRTPKLPASLPKPLVDLMVANNVTEFEIQQVVNSKGYYPLDTPIENYDPGFVSGVLVGAWDQVYPGIEKLRETQPF